MESLLDEPSFNRKVQAFWMCAPTSQRAQGSSLLERRVSTVQYLERLVLAAIDAYHSKELPRQLSRQGAGNRSSVEDMARMVRSYVDMILDDKWLPVATGLRGPAQFMAVALALNFLVFENMHRGVVGDIVHELSQNKREVDRYAKWKKIDTWTRDIREAIVDCAKQLATAYDTQDISLATTGLRVMKAFTCPVHLKTKQEVQAQVRMNNAVQMAGEDDDGFGPVRTELAGEPMSAHVAVAAAVATAAPAHKPKGDGVEDDDTEDDEFFLHSDGDERASPVLELAPANDLFSAIAPAASSRKKHWLSFHSSKGNFGFDPMPPPEDAAALALKSATAALAGKPEGDEPGDETGDEPGDEPKSAVDSDETGDEPGDEPKSAVDSDETGDEPGDEPKSAVDSAVDGDEPGDDYKYFFHSTQRPMGPHWMRKRCRERSTLKVIQPPSLPVPPRDLVVDGARMRAASELLTPDEVAARHAQLLDTRTGLAHSLLAYANQLHALGMAGPRFEPNIIWASSEVLDITRELDRSKRARRDGAGPSNL